MHALPLRNPFVLVVGRLIVSLAILVACGDSEAQENDAFLEAQIRAIQTGDIEPLEPYRLAKPSVKLAAELTKAAVDELYGQVKIGRVLVLLSLIDSCQHLDAERTHRGTRSQSSQIRHLAKTERVHK
jgi:hypothetical protein